MIAALTVVLDAKGYEVAFLAEIEHVEGFGKTGRWQYEIPRPFWPLAIHTVRALRSRNEPAVAWALVDALTACNRENKWDHSDGHYGAGHTLDRLVAPKYTDEF